MTLLLVDNDLDREVQNNAADCFRRETERPITLGELIARVPKADVRFNVFDYMDERDKIEAVDLLMEQMKCTGRNALLTFTLALKGLEADQRPPLHSLSSMIGEVARMWVHIQTRKRLKEWADDLTNMLEYVAGISAESRISNTNPFGWVAHQIQEPIDIVLQDRPETPILAGTVYTWNLDGQRVEWLNIQRLDGETVLWDFWIEAKEYNLARLTPQAAFEAIMRAGMVGYAEHGRGVVVISQGKMVYIAQADMPTTIGSAYDDVRQRVASYNPNAEVIVVADDPGGKEAKIANMPIPPDWRMQE